MSCARVINHVAAMRRVEGPIEPDFAGVDPDRDRAGAAVRRTLALGQEDLEKGRTNAGVGGGSEGWRGEERGKGGKGRRRMGGKRRACVKYNSQPRASVAIGVAWPLQ